MFLKTLQLSSVLKASDVFYGSSSVQPTDSSDSNPLSRAPIVTQGSKRDHRRISGVSVGCYIYTNPTTLAFITTLDALSKLIQHTKKHDRGSVNLVKIL